MASLLYCVTQPTEMVGIASGVCGSPVQSRESAGLRAYWSEIASPEAFLGEPEALKTARLQFHQVLREILAATTPIPFRFPTLLESEAILAQAIASEKEFYRAALERIGEALQYDIIASWDDDEQADLATPVSGSEYRKRHQQALARIAAVDTKLKSVTAGSVREWRARQERKTHHWFALVPRDSRERFVASLRSAGASQGVRLRLHGPRPPSEFVTPCGEPG
jgi:Gas vesicle synthesis protein GvpL/GvpF